MNRVALLSIVAAFLSFSSAQTCPETDCKSGRIELQREFVVTATYGGKPLPGVIVEVTTEKNGETSAAFSGDTADNGAVKIKVDPGEYWITTLYLGHESLQCIRVAAKSSKDRKREFTYEWGAGAPATKQIAGKLIDKETRAGTAGTKLKLRAPGRTGITVVSGPGGSFSFEGTPPGTYVLQVAAGTTHAGKHYMESTFVLTVSPEAKANQLTVKRREAPNGDCRNSPTDLELATE